MKIRKLQPLVGKWKTSGVVEESPFGPAGFLRGTDEYEWFDRKDFLIHRVDVKMCGQKVKNCEAISYDKVKDAYAHFAFDNGMVAGIQYSRFKGRKWLIDGSAIRFRGEFNRSHSKLTGEWQYKAGRSWKHWMTVELAKT